MKLFICQCNHVGEWNCVCRSVKHSVAKFFGVADEDEAKRERTFRKWQASTRRLQNRSFVLSRQSTQRKTAPQLGTSSQSTMTTRPTSAAEYEMAVRRSAQHDTESAVTSQQLLSSARYDSPDSGVTSATTQRGVQPPHPLDPHATPPMYVAHYSTSVSC